MALNWSIEKGRFYLAPASGNCFALNGLSGSIPLHDRDHRVAAALTVIGNLEDFSADKLPQLAKTLCDAAKLCENI